MKRKFGGQDRPMAKKARFAQPVALVRQPAFRGQLPASLRGVRPEIKSVDFPVVASSPKVSLISTTAIFDLLNGIQEGAAFYNRVGRKVMLKSVHVKGSLQLTVNGANVAEYNRILLIYDRQPNGAPPAIADLLLDYDNQGATATNSNSSINMNNAERFIILRDARIQIPQNEAAAAASCGGLSITNYGDQANINWFVKLNNLETHYKSSSNPSVIGDIATGALFVVTFGSVAAATAGYDFVYSARLRYHDV